MLADLLVLFVVELDLDLQRSSIRGITRSTFFNRILYIIRAEFKVSEFKAELPAIVLNRRYVIKSLPETVCQEPLVMRTLLPVFTRRILFFSINVPPLSFCAHQVYLWAH